MKRFLWILAALGSGALLWWLVARRSAPPELPFTRVNRETIVSTLSTNGKAEPLEWAPARVERAGLVNRIFIHKGQTVARGAPLVELDSRDIQTALANAEARITEATAELDLLNRGGRAAEIAPLDSGLAQARLDLEAARKDYESLQRLAAEQAATPLEVRTAKERMDRAQAQIRGFDERRAALVAPTDKTIAQAKLSAAQADAALAQRNLALSTVRAPIPGVIYQFDLKPGAYLNPGDLIANIGQLANVRVTIYVDEPELGRVEKGMPVVITWDALPGRQWSGTVEKLPTQIVALGTRQVGEVGCIIGNPGNDLLPGTNVNVEIRSKVVPDALTLPK
ncbi:MAG: efflux RND transporter periplasmic adaptor subunit, partial [Bryobacteraceae bacterium]